MEKDASLRVMQYRSFVDVWHKPPRTSIYDSMYVQYVINIVTKLRQLSQRKIKLCLLLNFLIILVKERQSYLDSCLESKAELSKNPVPNFAHYTFDFA